MHFLDIFQCYSRVHNQVLTDLQINFTHNDKITLAEQRVIRKNTARNGIFYGHQSSIAKSGVGSGFYHILEPGTGQDIGFLPKKNPDRFLVKTSFISLNGYSLNRVLHMIKKSRFLTGILLLRFIIIW